MNKESYISVVVPVHNEEGQIQHFFEVVREIFEQANQAYEFVFVDDGSNDASWILLTQLLEQNERIKLIRLSRNFGKEAAISAGLDSSSGDAVIVIDADFQHPPELMPEMVRLWRDDGYMVVEAVKENRGDESWLRNTLSQTFYSIMSRGTGFNMSGASDYKLMDRKVVNTIRGFTERVRFFRGISSWVGYKRTTISFDVQPREGGGSSWGLMSLINLAINAITSFSAIPLYLVSILGGAMLFISIVLGFQTLSVYLSGNAVDGFTSVILLQLIIGACSMFGLGLLGLYVARLYEEVKARPQYITEDSRSSLRECDSTSHSDSR